MKIRKYQLAEFMKLAARLGTHVQARSIAIPYHVYQRPSWLRNQKNQEVSPPISASLSKWKGKRSGSLAEGARKEKADCTLRDAPVGQKNGQKCLLASACLDPQDEKMLA